MEITREKEVMVFKELQLELENPLSNNELNSLNEFKSKLSNNSISIYINNNAIKILLREVDLLQLRSLNDYLSKKYNLDENNNPVKQIISKIESIKSYGLRSGKRKYVDYNKEIKVKDRKLKEVKRGKHYYTRNNSFVKENNDCPNEFINQIICGDSEEALKKLPDNCIDLIFTSPPYNFGLDYLKKDDDYQWENYFGKLFSIFKECIRVLKYGGRIIVNTQPLYSDYIPCHHIISNFFMQNKLIWKGEIVWEKNNYNCKYTAWGSWKSPSNPYLKNSWEYLEIFCKGDLKKQGRVEDIDINKDEFKKWVFSRWSIAPERKMKEFGHPAMFPEELVRRVLKLFSFKNDVILDPFNGVGTTTVVAKNLDRKYIGIDISEEYSKVAQKRISSTLF